MLNDHGILRGIQSRGIVFDPPLSLGQLQGASVDAYLGTQFIYPQFFADTQTYDGCFVVEPMTYLLASLTQRLTLDAFHAAEARDKSTWLRRGITIGRGLFDPGWDGVPTIEIFNGSSRPVILVVGEPICQLVFTRFPRATKRVYNGRYQGSTGVLPAILRRIDEPNAERYQNP